MDDKVRLGFAGDDGDEAAQFCFEFFPLGGFEFLSDGYRSLLSGRMTGN
ncbi:MAG: hypothetical protein LBB83_04315 [Treponema sp.]|nr:hypothetical protein [Treponema sp.]